MTSVNEARRLPPNVGTRIVITGRKQIYPPPNSENLPCDASHLAGDSDTGGAEEQMLKLIKEKLPRIDFPVRVGSTGYIIWPNDNVLPTYGYTLDEIGRTVGIVDEIRFFQRYTENCMLVGDMGREEMRHFATFTQDEKDILLNILNDIVGITEGNCVKSAKT
uniref:Uncharacterized protein n=1 Tax=Marseillevirus LCMAC101 TaxID=2506602 RepID=A0A481YR22_9VIRU|nr:MAG: hypothetical protein LCMAC101_03080 [Marseillevirus LCMAC101]